MKRLALALTLVAALLGGGFIITSAQGATFQQKRAFGTITRGSTVCVGPIGPSDGTSDVQISGFTNGNPSLTWQILTVSSQTAPRVIFQTTARFVDHSEPPQGNLLFEACVVKNAQAAQDFDISLNSPPVE